MAGRSASAAKEIKELIAYATSQVENGGKFVDEARGVMGQIVQSVQRVTNIMAEITAASREQSAGIEQVNMAMMAMDEMTQQNAALVEEAAAAAESMKAQAVALSQSVGIFKTSNRDRFTEAPEVEATMLIVA